MLDGEVLTVGHGRANSYREVPIGADGADYLCPGSSLPVQRKTRVGVDTNESALRHDQAQARQAFRARRRPDQGVLQPSSAVTADRGSSTHHHQAPRDTRIRLAVSAEQPLRVFARQAAQHDELALQSCASPVRADRLDEGEAKIVKQALGAYRYRLPVYEPDGTPQTGFVAQQDVTRIAGWLAYHVTPGPFRFAA